MDYHIKETLHHLGELIEPDLDVKYSFEAVGSFDEIVLSDPYNELDEIEELPHYLIHQAD